MSSTQQIPLRVTSEQKKTIERRARAAGMSREQYMRTVLFKRPCGTAVRIDSLYLELSKQIDEVRDAVRELDTHLLLRGETAQEMRDSLLRRMDELNTVMHDMKVELSGMTD